MSNVFDIDARKGSYEPLTVRFRGAEYVLGRSASHVLGALAIHAKLAPAEGETEQEASARMIAILPSVLGALCPGFPATDLTVGEEFALMQAATEVLGRVAQVRFPAAQG